MKKPSKTLQLRADNFIAVLKAYKLGRPIQYKGTYSDQQWEDVDLASKLTSKGAAQYRIKPI